MPGLNNCKLDTTSQNIDWIALSIELNKLSKHLRNNSKEGVTDGILFLFHENLQIANQYDINMNDAWDNWKIKANKKHYITNN
mgnify:CR=1 FL=1